ncbi:MAG: hypothetical protein MJ090_03185 [Clostridia bacterium]|nr:hypothetical protein [Clostridia bacterium]
MKKKAICIFLILIVVSLTGNGDYTEADSSYIVTAIGFDGEEKINVSVEVVTAGGSERSETPTSEIISGKGDTPMDAVFSLNSQITKNLLFDHCTAIIIGRNLSKTNLGEVLKYGNELKELNFAVDMFVCENASQLLEKSDSVSVSRGFDIAANVKETEREIGIDYKNNFYEIYKAYEHGENYSFPFIKNSDKKIIIDGLSVYKKKEERSFLTNEEALLYSFVTDNNGGGKIYLDDQYANISSGEAKFNPKTKKYEISLCIKDKSRRFSEIFKQKTEKLLVSKKQEIGFKTDKITVKERQGI